MKSSHYPPSQMHNSSYFILPYKAYFSQGHTVFPEFISLKSLHSNPASNHFTQQLLCLRQSLKLGDYESFILLFFKQWALLPLGEVFVLNRMLVPINLVKLWKICSAALALLFSHFYQSNRQLSLSFPALVPTTSLQWWLSSLPLFFLNLHPCSCVTLPVPFLHPQASSLEKDKQGVLTRIIESTVSLGKLQEKVKVRPAIYRF